MKDWLEADLPRLHLRYASQVLELRRQYLYRRQLPAFPRH